MGRLGYFDDNFIGALVLFDLHEVLFVLFGGRVVVALEKVELSIVQFVVDGLQADQVFGLLFGEVARVERLLELEKLGVEFGLGEVGGSRVHLGPLGW